MGWIEEARRDLRAVRQPLLEAISMAKPYLPLALFCLNRKTAGIYASLFDRLATEATRPPFDCDLAFRRFA